MNNHLRVLRLIRRMHYDDRLTFTNRIAVEWLYLLKGLPQYRVFDDTQLLGAVHVRHFNRLPVVQFSLAAWLVASGCQAEGARLSVFAATTPPTAKVRDLPRLPLQMPFSLSATLRVG
jgi:hypothetical protein